MIRGHDTIREMLSHAIENRQLPHALMFCGAKGTGKYSLGIELLRHLNCTHAENNQPCNDCSNCRRIRTPFPFHPDVMILRELTTPLFLKRDHILERYFSESGLSGHAPSEDDFGLLTEAIEFLSDQSFLIRSYTCRESRPPVDIIRINPDKMLTQAFIDKHASNPLRHWLYQKIRVYQESHCYSESIKIDNIRDIQKMLYLHPFEGKYKAVIIDDADRMLTPAQNCLLKILEEPPQHSILILIVTHPKGLLPTIRSRCQVIPFSRLPGKIMIDTLVGDFGWDPEAAAEYAGQADGSIAAALGTDWEAEREAGVKFADLFDAANEQDAGWVLRVAGTIVSVDPAGQEEGLNRFYRWIHDRICADPDSDTLTGCLPQGRPLTTDWVVKILDGIDEIIRQTVYHTDIRLQLEAMLLRLLKELG